MSTRNNQDEKTLPMHSPATEPLVARAAHPLAAGTFINDRYMIDRELGQGGISVVYLARDTRVHSRPVVIKFLHDRFSREEWFRRKFWQEVNALARLRHPGIVEVFDTGETPDTRQYFVMQYVEGGDLRAALEDGSMSFTRAARLLRQIGQALSAAHEKGVVHRDLKPENIMLQALSDGEEQARVIDFGIATIYESQPAADSATTAVTGTPAYMAPEQLRGRPTAASDIYALGVIAYEMLTGKTPFKTTSAVEQYEMQQAGVRERPRQLRPDLPAAAEQAILKALAFAPERRYRRARDFGDDLARALTPATTARRLSGLFDTQVTGDRLRLAKRGRKPAMLALALAVLLVLVGVGALVYFKGRPAPPPPAERRLNYGVIMLRDGERFPEPAGPAARIEYQARDRCEIAVDSPQAGHLYIINEGAYLSDEGLPQYAVLFPAPPATSAVTANQPVRLPDLFFSQWNRAERVWLIWSARPVEEFEAAAAQFNALDRGLVDSPELTGRLRQFFLRHGGLQPAEQQDVARRISLRQPGDLLVYPVVFEPARR